MSEKLWSDDKSLKKMLSFGDQSSVIYNLHEDITCLKEDVISMRTLIIDLQATLKNIQNSSNSMMRQCDEDRKRLSI